MKEEMKDLKKRKRGFWALCLAAMLSLMPGMQTMAANVSLGSDLSSTDTDPAPSRSNIGVDDTLTWSLSTSGYSHVYYSADPGTELSGDSDYKSSFSIAIHASRLFIKGKISCKTIKNLFV